MDKIEKKRINDLYKISSCLTDLKIHHVIFDGALLGFIREKNLIKWDWDIEFSLYENDLTNNLVKLIDEVKRNGFKIHKIDKNCKINLNLNLAQKVQNPQIKHMILQRNQKLIQKILTLLLQKMKLILTCNEFKNKI